MNPVFIGHGSPMNAIAYNRYTQFLKEYRNRIAVPEYIVVISAHWQTDGTYITGNAHPEQLYDFYGFPDELYNIRYRPLGSTELAQKICREIGEIRIDYERGIDHAGWAIAKYLYPDQSIPLLELSLDIKKTALEHFALGKQLMNLKNEGILFIGSGNLVHNLYEARFEENAVPFMWAQKADFWIKEKLESEEISDLILYKEKFPQYKRVFPSDEHYIPLLYILGMKRQSVTPLFEQIQNGCISMRSIEVS